MDEIEKLQLLAHHSCKPFIEYNKMSEQSTLQNS